MGWRAQQAWDDENELLLKEIDWRDRIDWSRVFVSCFGVASVAYAAWSRFV